MEKNLFAFHRIRCRHTWSQAAGSDAGGRIGIHSPGSLVSSKPVTLVSRSSTFPPAQDKKVHSCPRVSLFAVGCGFTWLPPVS